MNKKLSRVTYATTFILIIIFTALCLCFIPNFADYLSAVSKIPLSAKVIHTVVLAGGTVLALPCLVILFLAFKLSRAVANDSIFTSATASTLSLISVILLADCVVFMLPVAFLIAAGELVVSPILAMLALVGSGLAILLRVLAEYIKRAAVLKEEADATL